MRDDFSALDLLSADALNRSKMNKRAKKLMKALLGLPRRKGKGKRDSNNTLATLLPELVPKVKQKRNNTLLEGWPVALHWPSADQEDNEPRIHH